MEQVLIVLGVTSLLMMAGTAAVGFVAVRGLRRRWRSARRRLTAVRVRQGSLPAPPAHGRISVAALGSPTWWALQHRRHQLWSAVTAAEQAVDIAGRSDVALGELPQLTRQLRSAATSVDAVLRAGGRMGSLSEEDRADCDQVRRAAADIHDAALSSLRAASHADTAPVVSAVRVEVTALAAGVRAAFR